MRKILWLDIEAADYKTDREGAVHQISMILDIDGVVVWTGDFHCKPFPSDLVNMPSLSVCGVSYEQIMEYPPAVEGFKEIVNSLHPHKRLVIGGYNLSYDIPVFTNWWYKCVKELKKWDLKWVDYVYADPLDVRALAIEHLLEQRGDMKDFKLMTVAYKMGVEIDESKAHNSLYDIEITRQIYYKIKNGKSN